MGERITAAVAAIPERERRFKKMVERIRPQVDELCVYLNGWKHVPDFLEGCTVARSQEHGDRGDAGKFFWAGSRDGWMFTCDDDILYPHGYVDTMRYWGAHFERRVVLSAHGKAYGRWPVSFFKPKRGHPCRKVEHSLVFVNVPGTGVSAFHSSTFDAQSLQFDNGFMADLWFGAELQRQRVPIAIVPHPSGWIQSVQPREGDTLWARAKRNSGRVQTMFLQQHAPWVIYGCEVL